MTPDEAASVPAEPAGVRRARPLLLAVAALLVVAAVLSGYARDVLLDQEEFTDRGVQLLDEPAVQAELGEAAADALVAQEPDLLAVRPLLVAVAEPVVASDPAEDIARVGLAQLHAELLDGEADALSVRLADLLLVVDAQAQALLPDLAPTVPPEASDQLLTVSSREEVASALEAAAAVDTLGLLLPVAALGALAAVVLSARRRRDGLAQAGLVLVGAGLVVVLAEATGRAVLRRAQDREALVAVWDVFVGGLGTWGSGVFVVGAVLVLAARTAVQPLGVADLLERARRAVVAPPTSRAAAVARGVGVFLLGVWLLADPLAAVATVASLLGLLLLAAAASWALAALGPVEDAQRSGARDAGETPPLGAARAAAAVVLLVGLLAVGAVALVRSVGQQPAAVAATAGCNGSVLLCDRTLDDVALAATHNSMSSAADGFLVANHPRGIVEQLDAGYRGLLVDTAYGFDTGEGLVVTDRSALDADRAELVAELGESAVRAAEALAERQEVLGNERDTYLCHGLCEAGATPLVPALEEVRTWLESHPREVLVVVVQDEVTPDDTAAAFERAGLLPLVHTQQLGRPFPTLRQMVESGRRVFVLMEDETGDVPWLHDALDFVQETPFGYSRVEDFDCAPNRGRPDNPLFLVNHFITPASASAGERANSEEVLSARLQRCVEERGLVPNLVAVDFFASGEVLQVVDELNGVRTAR